MQSSNSGQPAHRAWIQQARLQSDQADSQAAEVRLVAGRPAAAAVSADFVPGYEIENEIHRGAQGIVYRAVQKSTGRRVALKLLHDQAFGGPLERARFEREMRILAALQHPNIVAIHDGGSHGGRFFLVMDYIAGQPLDVYMAGQPRSIRETLDLFIPVCDAVNAAHVRGIIHRDLKPANVRVDAAGRPFVLDFGLAKQVADATDETAVAVTATAALTMTGQFLGSLPWSAPEQADGSPTRVDIRTDVYSLGVLLYQMLTGRFPYRVAGPMKQVFEAILHAAPTPPRSVRREIDDELETIVLQCLSKERERRYQTAGLLAADLRRYLAGEPIEAKRESGWYILRKTLHRYRGRAGVAAGFVVLVTASAIALSILYARQGELLVEVQQKRDKAVAAEQLADQRFRQAEYESYVANIAAADAAIAASDGGAALARLRAVPAALRNWEWRHLIGMADQSSETWRGPPELIAGRVRLSSNGAYLCASFWLDKRGSELRVWPLTSHELVADLSSAGQPDMPVLFLAEGRQLLACDHDGVFVQFDLQERKRQTLQRVQTLNPVISASSLSPDVRTLLAATKLGYFLWDIPQNRLLHELQLSNDVWVIVSGFDATGSRLALGLNDGTVPVLDVASGRILSRISAHPGQVYGVAFSPNSRLLATAGGEGGELKLWDMTALNSPAQISPSADAPPVPLIRELRGGGQRVGAMSFSPDGTLLAAPSEDKTVRLWSVADGQLQSTLLGHTTGVVCTDFRRDGRFIVSGAREGVVKLWDLQRPATVHEIRDLPGHVDFVAFTPDGGRLFLHSGPVMGEVEISSGRWSPPPFLPAAPILGPMLLGPGGAQATYSDDFATLHIWNMETGAERVLVGGHRLKAALASDRSGRILVSADEAAVVLWDWAAGSQLRRFDGPGVATSSLVVSPDGDSLVLGLESGELAILDMQTGLPRRLGGEQRAHRGSIEAVAFSPDGRFLATGSVDRTVKLWNIASGRMAWSASPQLGDVWCTAFSPDGTRLAVGGRDRSVRLFDTQTGRELLALRGPTGTVMCVTFSPDGRRIAAGSWAREVFVWDVVELAGER